MDVYENLTQDVILHELCENMIFFFYRVLGSKVMLLKGLISSRACNFEQHVKKTSFTFEIWHTCN